MACYTPILIVWDTKKKIRWQRVTEPKPVPTPTSTASEGVRQKIASTLTGEGNSSRHWPSHKLGGLAHVNPAAVKQSQYRHA